MKPRSHAHCLVVPHTIIACIIIMCILITALLSADAQPAPSPERQANLPQADNAGDRMGYLDNGKIRLGVNLALGGAITYLALSEHSRTNKSTEPTGRAINLVNSYDWGRQIQMSHYSGPNPFAPNGKQPNKSWAGLGWNPIQSGDCFGNRSRILEYHNNGKTIYVKCVPMQWPLDNEPGECTFECWFQLEGAVVHVRSRLTNNRADTAQYQGRSQELPAVYTNAPWYRLMTYTGDRPFTHDTATQIPQVPPGASFPWAHWWGTEHWAALLDENDFGLGIFEPDTSSFLGGFAGKAGKGGPKDSPTGYIAPLQDEVLDHNIVYEYRYDLVVGKLEEIRGYVYSQHHQETPPVYTFRKDRQHWRYVNATDTGWPVRDALVIHTDKPGVQIIGPSAFWQAKDAPILVIEAAFTSTKDISKSTDKSTDKNINNKKRQLHAYWRRHGSPEFSAEKHQAFEVSIDGNYHRYLLDLSRNPEYRGAILGLRIDPPSGEPGDTVRIRSISFRQTPDPEFNKNL